MAAAVDAARAADVAILVLGERSGLTDDSTTGEFRDRSTLGFHGRQQELLEAVVATGTPVVLVVVSGRPLAIEWAAGHCHAVLLAWVPGDAGPDAIADVLTGATNPGGKLPISIPRHVGQVPVTYRHHPTGGHSQPKGDYVDGSVGAALAVRVRPVVHDVRGRPVVRRPRPRSPTDGGELVVNVDVENTGDRAGDEVVQLYVRDDAATVARPVRELRGFRRVTLEPGERRTVTFRISAEQFAVHRRRPPARDRAGTIGIAVGTSSVDLPLTASVTLTGPTVDLRDRRRYLTETTIS